MIETILFGMTVEETLEKLLNTKKDNKADEEIQRLLEVIELLDSLREEEEVVAEDDMDEDLTSSLFTETTNPTSTLVEDLKKQILVNNFRKQMESTKGLTDLLKEQIEKTLDEPTFSKEDVLNEIIESILEDDAKEGIGIIIDHDANNYFLAFEMMFDMICYYHKVEYYFEKEDVVTILNAVVRRLIEMGCKQEIFVIDGKVFTVIR